MESFSLAELAQHRTRQDAWISIRNKVYNVSGYLYDHPGGEEILLDSAGIDATAPFEDVGHSEDAYEMLESLLVGELSSLGRVSNISPSYSYGAIEAVSLPHRETWKYAHRGFLGGVVVIPLIGIGLMAPGLNWINIEDIRRSGSFWSGVLVSTVFYGLLIAAVILRLRKSISVRQKGMELYPAYLPPDKELADQLHQLPYQSALVD